MRPTAYHIFNSTELPELNSETQTSTQKLHFTQLKQIQRLKTQRIENTNFINHNFSDRQQFTQRQERLHRNHKPFPQQIKNIEYPCCSNYFQEDVPVMERGETKMLLSFTRTQNYEKHLVCLFNSREKAILFLNSQLEEACLKANCDKKYVKKARQEELEKEIVNFCFARGYKGEVEVKFKIYVDQSHQLKDIIPLIVIQPNRDQELVSLKEDDELYVYMPERINDCVCEPQIVNAEEAQFIQRRVWKHRCVDQWVHHYQVDYKQKRERLKLSDEMFRLGCFDQHLSKIFEYPYIKVLVSKMEREKFQSILTHTLEQAKISHDFPDYHQIPFMNKMKENNIMFLIGSHIPEKVQDLIFPRNQCQQINTYNVKKLLKFPELNRKRLNSYDQWKLFYEVYESHLKLETFKIYRTTNSKFFMRFNSNKASVLALIILLSIGIEPSYVRQDTNLGEFTQVSFEKDFLNVQ